MILTLVERRVGPDGTSAAFHAGSWDRLQRLAGELGRPDWGVDLVLVDDHTMVQLNRDYRAADGVTDVLSFSYLEESGVGEPGLERGRRGAYCDLWPSSLPGDGAVGELVLAPAFIAARCRENGWPLAEEIPLLVVHGCLHLLGWDHPDDTLTAAMRDLEQTILAGEGLPHPLRQRS